MIKQNRYSDIIFSERGAVITDILRNFEDTMVEAGRRLFEINLLLDTLIREILSTIEGRQFPLEARFPHYGEDGYRLVQPVKITMNEESETISITTDDDEEIPWEELGVSIKDFIANIIVLQLISDSNYELYNQ